MFQYFARYLKMWLELLVEATTGDLYLYMNTVLTNGPGRVYATTRFLATRPARQQLKACVIYLLKRFKEIHSLGFLPYVFSGAYYFPQFRHAQGYCRQTSHLIFHFLRGVGANGATQNAIRNYVQQNGGVFQRGILNMLVYLECVNEQIMSNSLIYTINFDWEFFFVIKHVYQLWSNCLN